jgi:hypothetical protein
MMARPGRWLSRWPGAERPDRRSFPQSGVRAAILVPRSVVGPLGIGRRCGPAHARLGRISCWESVLADSPFAPLGLSDRRLGETGAQDSIAAARGERQRAVGVARVQIRSCRLHRVSSSRRCSPPLLSPRGRLGQSSAGSRTRTAVRRRPCRLPFRDLPSGGRVPIREPRSIFTSVISEGASHEVPGFRAPALPSLSASKPGAHLGDRVGPGRPPHPAGGGDPAFAATATGLACRCLDAASLPVQRHPRSSNRVGEEGRASEELSGSAGQALWS